MDWGPQAPLTAFHACRRLFLWKTNSLFHHRKVYFCPKPLFEVVFDGCFYKTPNRRGTQFHVEKLPNFVLSSNLDPIGDQNDV